MLRTTKCPWFLWFEYVAILIIVIAFFIISYCGFFTGDDIYMYHGVSTLSDVFEHTKMFYFTWGGRLFSVASQYLFCGVFGDNRIWFAIMNTLFFILLILVCGRLIDDSNEDFIFRVLLFTLLFWFLCPIPSQTLFWAAVSTTHMWANVLTFVFLLLFEKYKDDDFGIVKKLGLFFLSIFSATEFIPCVSICGAFVVYYVLHIKRFKGNAVPFIFGFVTGSMLLLVAPGNFERAGIGGSSVITSLYSNINYLLHHLVQEIVKYKILWVFLVILIWGWTINKTIVKAWVKNNSVLLLSLGWSVIAFSVVFMPDKRALFFTETLSLVMFLRFLFDNHSIFKIRFIGEFLSRYLSIVRSAMITLLFVMFTVDSVYAIIETKRQSKNNDVFLNEIVKSGGIVALDQKFSSHRMAYVSRFPDWAWEPLADKYGLDSVHVYPYYCLEKYYQDSPLENVYVENNNRFAKEIRIIARIENENLQESSNFVVFTIDYSRPRKWYKSWLDKWRNYQYDRTVAVEVDKPDCCFEDYCYYIIWLKRENAKNLKSIRYEFK